MGYLVFVSGRGWLLHSYKTRYGNYMFTQNRSEAHIWWTFSGAKRMAHKIFGAHIEEL